MASWTEVFPNSTGAPVKVDAVDGSGMPVADNTWALIGAATGDTEIPIGGGGLSTITPVADNRLAVWGRDQTYFDSGTLRFRVGRRNTSDGNGQNPFEATVLQQAALGLWVQVPMRGWNNIGIMIRNADGGSAVPGNFLAGIKKR